MHLLTTAPIKHLTLHAIQITERITQNRLSEHGRAANLQIKHPDNALEHQKLSPLLIYTERKSHTSHIRL